MTKCTEKVKKQLRQKGEAKECGGEMTEVGKIVDTVQEGYEDQTEYYPTLYQCKSCKTCKLI